mgnify:CR=1 FL=1
MSSLNIKTWLKAALIVFVVSGSKLKDDMYCNYDPQIKKFGWSSTKSGIGNKYIPSNLPNFLLYIKHISSEI